MRYVIVCVVEGEAGEYNHALKKGILDKWKIKSSKLPAHFTIKAPFEYDGDIYELEDLLETFCKREKAGSFRLEGYDHFDKRVIYMKVNMSEQGKLVHDRLIDEMMNVPYLDFMRHDGKDKIFHVTVASKKLTPVYEEVWNYVHNYPYQFECYFNNICIYEWQQNTWKLHRYYRLAQD
ncbi:MAG: 2'-5' RNA ligase family protein [Clostridium sp.]|nr:2'-5' RNA ligase family protein [Clostridium sp.]